jgi:uncharacterized protein YkwD
MRARFNTSVVFVLFLLAVQPLSLPVLGIQPPVQEETESATPQELIAVTNAVRTGNGLQALTVNSILMSTAQQTADYMAANQMMGHIGGVRNRIMAAGYGSGKEAWATENIMNGAALSADTIVREIWSDDLHSIPVLNPIYCDIGAGVAIDSDGDVYYVVHAAYSEKRYCGPYIAPDGTTLEDLATPLPGVTAFPLEEAMDLSEFIYAVRTTTPDPAGDLVHVVQPGQSLWSIAIAYGTRIKEIQRLNGLPEDWFTVYTGQKLLVAKSVTPNLAALQSADTPQFEPGTRTPTWQMLTPVSAVLGPTASALPTPTARAPVSSEQILLKVILGTAGLGLVLVFMGLVARRPAARSG